MMRDFLSTSNGVAFKSSLRSISIAFFVMFTSAALFAADDTLDVNDVSILWPVPKTQADVGQLIPADEPTSGSTILPEDVFRVVIDHAEKVSVRDALGDERKINFEQFKDEYAKVSTWKVAGIRIDPSALGTNPEVMKNIAEIPQLRLVLQPVKIANGKPLLPDFTAHVVYSFVLPPPEGKNAPQPDRVAFKAIVDDVLKIKRDLKEKGTTTTGKLTVHPGLVSNPADMVAAVRSLIQKHLKRERLSGVAFMGVDSSDPWIFLSLEKKGGSFELKPHPTLGGQSAEMVTLLAGLRNKAVRPIPATTNLDGTRGVSTAGLFFRDVMDELDKTVFDNVPALKVRHIPDFIANPVRAHFLNTDCVSCHSESTLRKSLNLGSGVSDFRYSVPAGISSVDDNMLPVEKENFRNFGWFSAGVAEGVPTVTMRTANESAASADYINRCYLKMAHTPAP